MNALEWNRDLSRPIEEIRDREQCADRQAGSRTRNRLVRRDAARPRRAVRRDADRALRRARQPAAAAGTRQEQAWAMTQGQLAWYRAMEERGELTPIVGSGGTRSASRALAAGPMSHDGADRLRAEPRGRRLDRDARAPRAGLRQGSAGRRARRTTVRASTRTARTPPAISARAGASCCARWSGSGSSSMRRTSATTASATRSITSTARSGRATPTAARSCRTTASSLTIKSAS